MVHLEKRDLVEKVIRSVKDSGWNLIYLTNPSQHPFRFQAFRDNESYRVKVYIWNLTHGGGVARPADEYRIQITGVSHFEPEQGGKTLILGWWDEVGVFAGFDFRKHQGRLGASPSMQIREEFLRSAYANGFSPCNKGNGEVAIAFRPNLIMDYVRVLDEVHDVGRSPSDFKVLARVAESPAAVNDSEIERVSRVRRTAVAMVKRALRESSFKDRVLTAYGHHCSLCGLQLDLVEAAHIVPVAVADSTDDTSNGLALCVLHHRAYDKAIVAVGDDYHVLMSAAEKGRLEEIGHDSGVDSFMSALRPLILLPPAVNDRPNVRCLRKGREVRHWNP